MNWDFIEEDLLELLEANGLMASNVERFEDMVHRFIVRLRDNYNEEDRFEGDRTDPEW